MTSTRPRSALSRSIRPVLALGIGAALVAGAGGVASATELIETFDTDTLGGDALITADGTRILAVSGGSNLAAISVIDSDPTSPTYNTELRTGGTADEDYDTLVLHPEPTVPLAYLTAYGANEILVIDFDPASPTAFDILERIAVPDRPAGMVFSADGSRAYVGHAWLGTISVLDTDASSPTHHDVIATYDIDGDFGLRGGMLLSPDERRLYIDYAGVGGSELWAVDVEIGSPTVGTVVDSTPLTGNVISGTFILSASGTALFALTPYGGDTYAVDIDPTSPDYLVATPLGLTDGYRGGVLTPDGRHLYLSANGGDPALVLVDVDPASATYGDIIEEVVCASANSTQPVLTPDGTRLYIASVGWTQVFSTTGTQTTCPTGGGTPGGGTPGGGGGGANVLPPTGAESALPLFLAGALTIAAGATVLVIRRMRSAAGSR